MLAMLIISSSSSTLLFTLSLANNKVANDPTNYINKDSGGGRGDENNNAKLQKPDKCSLLLASAYKGDIVRVTALLATDREASYVNICRSSQDGKSALIWAAQVLFHYKTTIFAFLSNDFDVYVLFI